VFKELRNKIGAGMESLAAVNQEVYMIFLMHKPIQVLISEGVVCQNVGILFECILMK
jgi:hypothetical protein